MPIPLDGHKGESHMPDFPFFVARQPIVDEQAVLVAYELLFRGCDQAGHAEFPNGSVATAQVLIDGIGVDGLDSLVGDADVFLNFDRNLLVSRAALALHPAQRFVVEVLEDVEPDDEVLCALEELRANGFRVALDDVTSSERVRASGRRVDCVKIDLRAIGYADLQTTILAAGDIGASVLAEKVESSEEFADMRRLGVQLFQGYFLGRPETKRRTSLPSLSGPQASFVRCALSDELNLDDIVRAVTADPALTYRLLTMTNSASARALQPVTSIRTAVIRVGQGQLRRLAAMLAFAPSVSDRGLRVALDATLLRACFSELAGTASRSSAGFDCFVAGILSGLDEYLGVDLAPPAWGGPSVEPAVRAILEGRKDRAASVNDVVRAYQAGAWMKAETAARRIGLDPEGLPELYRKAVTMADELTLASAD